MTYSVVNPGVEDIRIISEGVLVLVRVVQVNGRIANGELVRQSKDALAGPRKVCGRRRLDLLLSADHLVPKATIDTRGSKTN